MRTLALAAVFGVVALAGPAAADPWTHPNGDLAINAPRGWTIQPRNMQGGSAALAFTPSSDCYFFAIPNPAIRDVNAALHRTAQLTNDQWATVLRNAPDLANAGPVSVTSSSVDTSGFWPVQRAQFQVGSNTVYGAVETRPGFELSAFCSGGDASYDAILNSFGHAGDAAWQAQAGAAPPQQPAAPPAQ